MLARKEIEKRERETLSKFATLSENSKGRVHVEDADELRTCFQRDRDRIIHSKAFRRLMHKTQVFLSPEGDHYRTRLTHTLEVAQIARTIARALNLNEDLTEAIAMGHDLGHTPFGHNGEMYLAEIHPGGFKHNVQSLRVVDVIEKNRNGRSMNLTAEVRDGILNHNGSNQPFTPEGMIVKLSDRIAYINHDIDDALRSGAICEDDLPKDCISVLGDTHSKRINYLVLDTIKNSEDQSEIKQSPQAKEAMNSLRSWLMENVYKNPDIKHAKELFRIEKMIKDLYSYYLEKPDELPTEYLALVPNDGIQEAVKDYIAGMTDRYAIKLYTELFVPQGWKLDR